MTNLLRLEYLKIRRKKILPMITMFLGIEMLWAFIVVNRHITVDPDQAIWESILYTVTSLNGLFMPLVSAIVISRICDMEHKGSTMKMLVATNVSRVQLYAAKYICANSLLLFVTFAQIILMISFGLIKNVSGAIPIQSFFVFIVGAMLTTLAITALQQWISMVVKNQAFALCFGMLGSFIGMTAGLFPAAVRNTLIWSYYLDLSPVIYLFSESSGTYMSQPVNIGLVTTALVMTILFFIAGNIHMTRQEI